MGTVTASADVFRALADPTRRALLVLLRDADRTVVQLRGPFRISQPAISQHLKILRDVGLVHSRRDGRRRLYRLNPKPIEQVYKWAAEFERIADPFGHVWSFRAAGGSTGKTVEGGRHKARAAKGD